MTVLHLFSNAKWTGPAEPALNLCLTLRRLGVEADFACPPTRGWGINKVVETARDRGLEPIQQFHLSKHFHPVRNALDRLALPGFLEERHYDLIHCHLDNDHRIALGPAKKLRIPLVRSSYEGAGFQNKRHRAKSLAGTTYLIEPSQRALAHDAATYGFPRERMQVIPGAVDLERFDPAREVPDARRRLGIPPEAFVVGIVARLQPHRHYEDFFLAIRKLVDVRDNVHAIVVGRGTHQEKVGKQPARELGLEGHVHFPGYVDGEDYVGMLKAFDANVFLVPGSDGTCRAVREAMAMGKPALVADRGMLREIVDDGENGMVCDGSPQALFEALDRMCSDRQWTCALGRGACQKTLTQFSLERQGRAVMATYEAALSHTP